VPLIGTLDLTGAPLFSLGALPNRDITAEFGAIKGFCRVGKNGI